MITVYSCTSNYISCSSNYISCSSNYVCITVTNHSYAVIVDVHYQ